MDWLLQVYGTLLGPVLGRLNYMILGAYTCILIIPDPAFYVVTGTLVLTSQQLYKKHKARGYGMLVRIFVISV